MTTPKESGWRERLEDLAAINYNLYLAGTVERADTGEKWTHEQALQELKEFIAAEIATAIAATEVRVVEEILAMAPGFENTQTGEVTYDVGVMEYMARIKAIARSQGVLEDKN